MRRNSLNILITFLLLWLSITSSVIVKAETDRELFIAASLQLNNGNYQTSKLLFSKLTSYTPRIGEAVATYKLDNKPLALSLFKRSILLANSDYQRYLALYNAAVISYEMGDYTQAKALFLSASKYNLDTKQSLYFYQAASYLEKITLAKIESLKANTSKKPGPGSKTLSLDIQFDDDINLKLEDSTSTENIKRNISSYIPNNFLLNDLIEKGIKNISTPNNIATNNFNGIEPDLLTSFAIANGTISSSNKRTTADYWRRIFELEVGFPAPLEKAETLPGVRPW